MDLTHLCYYIIFVINVSVSCAPSENKLQLVSDRRFEKRIAKRDAPIVLVDNVPEDAFTRKRPTIFYRQSKRQFYRPRGKMASVNTKNIKNSASLSTLPANISPKQKKNKVMKFKHFHRFNKNRYQKQRQIKSNVRDKSKPKNRAKIQTSYVSPPPRQVLDPLARDPHSYHATELEPAGFAEPPVEIPTLNKLFMQSYRSNLKQATIPDSEYMDGTNENQDTFSNPSSYKMNDELNNFAPSIKYQTYSHPNSFDTEPDDEFPSYFKSNINENENKKRPHRYYGEILKPLIKPRVYYKPKLQGSKEPVLVGGQYAEPPARLLSAPQQNEEELSETIQTESTNLIDLDEPLSAGVSPYVNYKNSNLAFSPQNLNDAFSIDK